jgi:hypothetical protein
MADHDLISGSPERSEEQQSKRKVGTWNICATTMKARNFRVF